MNIHFRALHFLATQVRDIHRISTGYLLVFKTQWTYAHVTTFQLSFDQIKFILLAWGQGTTVKIKPWTHAHTRNQLSSPVLTKYNYFFSLCSLTLWGGSQVLLTTGALLTNGIVQKLQSNFLSTVQGRRLLVVCLSYFYS